MKPLRIAYGAVFLATVALWYFAPSRATSISVMVLAAMAIVADIFVIVRRQWEGGGSTHD